MDIKGNSRFHHLYHNCLCPIVKLHSGLHPPGPRISPFSFWSFPTEEGGWSGTGTASDTVDQVKTKDLLEGIQ